MKILQISHNYHVTGGSDAVFFATSELLQRNGHQVVPFCIDTPKNRDTSWAEYFPKGADTKGKPIRDAWRYVHNSEAKRKLTRLIRDHGPFDAAHLHIYHGKQTPAILPVLRRFHIPIVQTLHEYKLACPVYTMQRGDTPCDMCISHGSINAVRNKCKGGSTLQSAMMLAEFHTSRLLGDVRLVDRFLCVSGFQRRVMQKAGIPAEKLRVLHNFVDQSAVPAGTQTKDHLLFFGRLEKLKGLPTLLDAVRRTGQKLVIAGEGAWKSGMEAVIKDMPNVTYQGFQSGDALQKLVATAKAVVVPSEWYENCPMSVLEAKAMGRPVVGARIGGIPELIRDGRDGFLFEPGNTDDLVKALGRVETESAEMLSTNARMDIANRFSAQHHLNALLDHYIDIQPRLHPQPLAHAQA